jgi:uncharacterized protein (DUF2235 family)
VVLLAVLLLETGCRTSKPQIVRSIRSGQVNHRKLMVFMDGTANTFESRTNIRRLFDLVTAQESPDVLAYYIEGVGTDSHRITGGMFGVGFSERVRDAATWISQNYQNGDSIFVFGFSRGAYEAMELSAFVGITGLPTTKDSRHSIQQSDHPRIIRSWYEDFRNAAAEHKAEKARFGTNRLHMEQRLVRRPSSNVGTNHVHIDVLGIWDSVEALGFIDFLPTAFGSGPKAEQRRQLGHRSHYIDLGPHVKHCFYALSLDERRQSFMPELPDHAAGEPGSYEFVWFAGDHSDIGGGHANSKELAGYSFNWMLQRINALQFPKGLAFPAFNAHQASDGRRHDLSLESRLMRPMRKRVRGEVFTDPTVSKEDNHTTVHPVRSAGWKMQVHESVLLRMQEPRDEAVGSRESHLLDESRDGYGSYVPWPFREKGGWVDHSLTPTEIQSRFPIVRIER